MVGNLVKLKRKREKGKYELKISRKIQNHFCILTVLVGNIGDSINYVGGRVGVAETTTNGNTFIFCSTVNDFTSFLLGNTV